MDFLLCNTSSLESVLDFVLAINALTYFLVRPLTVLGLSKLLLSLSTESWVCSRCLPGAASTEDDDVDCTPDCGEAVSGIASFPTALFSISPLGDLFSFILACCNQGTVVSGLSGWSLTSLVIFIGGIISFVVGLCWLTTGCFAAFSCICRFAAW